MKLKDLAPEKRGMAKGALGTALTFTAVSGIGLYFLHCWHEKEMDKLELDTADFCIEHMTKHYEGIIRRKLKEDGSTREEEELRTKLASACNELLNEHFENLNLRYVGGPTTEELEREMEEEFNPEYICEPTLEEWNEMGKDFCRMCLKKERLLQKMKECEAELVEQLEGRLRMDPAWKEKQIPKEG